MSTFRGSDNCTDTILEFVAGGVPEHPAGEAAGNYNAYFGRGDSTQDLSVRTINGIYDFQEMLLAQQVAEHGKEISSAVGRYQFLKDTLEGLQKELGLSGSDRFTPEMQDKLAWRLLVRRGFREWWRGEIDDAEFAHRLSMEWASLPDPQNGGRSHYDHDPAGNHTDTTVAAVLDMLSRARAAMPTTKQEHPMSDTSPQSVFGATFNEDDLVRKVVEQLAAQKPAPGAIRKAGKYLVDRLNEQSSKAGLAAIVALLIPALPDAQGAEIAQGIGALLALAAFFLKDRPGAPGPAKQASNA